MGEIRHFSKLGEVVAVKGFKLNELTNLPLARVLFKCEDTHSRVCSRATHQ